MYQPASELPTGLPSPLAGAAFGLLEVASSWRASLLWTPAFS